MEVPPEVVRSELKFRYASLSWNLESSDAPKRCDAATDSFFFFFLELVVEEEVIMFWPCVGPNYPNDTGVLFSTKRAQTAKQISCEKLWPC